MSESSFSLMASMRGNAGNKIGRTVGEMDRKVVAQPADGSCLFHSVAYGLLLANKNSAVPIPREQCSAAALRIRVADLLEANPDYKIGGDAASLWIHIETELSVSQYVHALRQRRLWGGAVELAILSQLYSVNIDVYRRTHQRGRGYIFECVAHFGRDEDELVPKNVDILYVGCSHYDALEPVEPLQTSTTKTHTALRKRLSFGECGVTADGMLYVPPLKSIRQTQ